MTTLPRPEYMWIALEMIPEATQERYQVQQFAKNGKVLVEISKGIYGLPHAGFLAQQRLNAHLAENGYVQTDTACLYKHKTRPIMFSLVVDDFGIKYNGQEHLDHLMMVLRLLYTITQGDGSKYVGITFEWDYLSSKRSVKLSMPGYIIKALARFGIISSPRTDSPGEYHSPVYGRKTPQQCAEDTSPMLSPERTKRLQQIVGVILYYARIIDSTMLHKISQIASAQAHPTEDVERAATHLLHYAATWPNAHIVYYQSQMKYHIQTDSSYLSEPKARSRVAAVHMLGDADTAYNVVELAAMKPGNGPILVRSSILDVVVSSAGEAEYGGQYVSGRDGEEIRMILSDMGYPQGTTPMQGDNSCAVGVANDSVKIKRAKAFDMRFNWIRDRVRQKHFDVFWRKGASNLADYFTKIHPVKHHRAYRHLYVYDPPQEQQWTSAQSRRNQTRQSKLQTKTKNV